jgi:hypothetical protein
MNKYKLYTLDVWGNEIDGFEVNDRRQQGTIELPDDFTDKQLLDAIDDLVGLDHAELADIQYDGYPEYIEINDKDTGMYVFQLELERE